MSRALGDFWSFDDKVEDYIVSPEPDINVIDFKPVVHKFLIVASDGLWNVMHAQAAVNIISEYKKSSILPPDKRNSCRHLIKISLDRWQDRRKDADNISVIVLFFDDEFLPSEYENVGAKNDSSADTEDANEDEFEKAIGSEKFDNKLLFRQCSLGKKKYEDTSYCNNDKKEKTMKKNRKNSYDSDDELGFADDESEKC